MFFTLREPMTSATGYPNRERQMFGQITGMKYGGAFTYHDTLRLAEKCPGLNPQSPRNRCLPHPSHEEKSQGSLHLSIQALRPVVGAPVMTIVAGKYRDDALGCGEVKHNPLQLPNGPIIGGQAAQAQCQTRPKVTLK